MSKAEDVLDALQGVFTCHCGRRYAALPERVIGVCEPCGMNWGTVMPGYISTLGTYISRDVATGWSSWRSLDERSWGAEPLPPLPE